MLESQKSTEQQGEIRLVRGCPCFKVFGDEKLCVNDDEILEVDAIEVHPSLFAFHSNREGMKQEMAKEDNVCYCAIYINYPDNKVYCISQGWVLRIHGKDVPGTDLEDALQFLSTKDMDASAEICSECLYKFLLTLSDIFADMMSKKEKTDEIKRYVDKFSLMIAVKHSQMEGMKPIGTEDDIEEGVDHFGFLREYLVQLINQQKAWSQRAENTDDTDIGEWKQKLFKMREKLARLEFQFYSQTLQLRDINDFHLLIKMLEYILHSSDEILNLNEEIHSEIRSKQFQELVDDDEQLASLSEYAEKSRTVEHNFGNILQILSRL
ncbi:MAG: hypothetical protein BAJATHORv1_10180 [Candidatus Thorarchaeota archaeon]|nr:MAG: hypothetical protein BAJATHORv1_10180 [Candidatus Thorarchaeota archaeon]